MALLKVLYWALIFIIKVGKHMLCLKRYIDCMHNSKSKLYYTYAIR